jgi:hypothetical protein
MPSKFGFETEEERKAKLQKEDDKREIERQRVKMILSPTADRIGPIIREVIADFFTSMGLSLDPKVERNARFIEKLHNVEGSWFASSRKITDPTIFYGVPGDSYQVHIYIEYSIQLDLKIGANYFPFLLVHNYESRLYNGPFPREGTTRLEVPVELKKVLEKQTGVMVQ